MTAFTHRLIKIRGDETWAEWGGQWWQHVDAITDLWWIPGWNSPPEWLHDHPHVKLDWGAVLVEVSREDVQRLLAAPPATHQPQGWLRQKQLAEELADGRYGVIWIEDTLPQVGPGQRFTHRPDAHIPMDSYLD